jgi:maleylacetate reductase
MRTAGTHLFPMMDKVIFGRPAAQALLEEVQGIRAALEERFAGLFDQIPQHTSRQSAVAAARAAVDVDADLIVAIGGGSVVDASKIVLICMEHEIFDPQRVQRRMPGDGYGT